MVYRIIIVIALFLAGCSYPVPITVDEQIGGYIYCAEMREVVEFYAYEEYDGGLKAREFLRQDD